MTTELTRIDAERLVCWLVANTFNVSPEEVTVSTKPEEVDGWDSLGHSVLLTRIVRRLGLSLDEQLAAPIDTVGEMVQRIGLILESRADV